GIVFRPGQTVACDSTIIADPHVPSSSFGRPSFNGGGKYISIDIQGNGFGTALQCVDHGGAIRGYHLDLFTGEGKASQAGWPSNVIRVGTCQVDQPQCPGFAIR